jgi:hypothetical protein
MIRFINPNRIIEACIQEPYLNSGENWDTTHTRGWQLSLTVGYDSDCLPMSITVERDTEQECIDTLIELGLTAL